MRDASGWVTKAAGLVFGLALLLVLAAPAQATVFPANGGQGDRAEEYRCPSGYVLVGLRGRTGAWIDQIGLICAQFQAPSYTSGKTVRPTPRGGNGGGPNEQYCDRDAGIRQIHTTVLADRVLSWHPTEGGYRRTPKFVSRIDFACFRPANGAAAGGRRFGGSGAPPRTNLVPEEQSPQTCPGNEYATGLSIRYGAHVNAVGLICGPVDGGSPAGNAGGAGNVDTDKLANMREKIGPDMENDTDRAGSDYHRFTLTKRDPAACQRACADDRQRCRAWTYVRPGVQGATAVCYLKDSVPNAARNACCISGIGPKKIVGLGKKPSGPDTPDPGDVAREPGGFAPAPARCKSGFVWREARPEDTVCVTPESRTQVRQENAAADSRHDPNGAWGPETCIAGFVWREAFNGDTVCVTPERRTAVKEENRVAPSRTE